MNRRPRYLRPVPRLAGLGVYPGVPQWPTAPPPVMTPPSMPMPAPISQPNRCGLSEESAQCVVEELRPLNFTRSENVLLALLAGGVIGYFIGKGK